MGKTKLKTVEAEEIAPVIASDSKAISEQEEIAASSASWRTPRNDNNSAAKKTKVSKRSKKAGVPKARSAKYKKVQELVNPAQKYSLAEAIKLSQEASYSKFNGTIEAHINTNAKNLRGLVSLPFMAGKQLRVLVFGKDAENSGADIIGTDETISEIEKGKIDFDVVVTTPAWMPKLAKIARKLGPRGLMPSPKNGTISENIEKTVAELKQGKTEYKTEPNGQVIHLSVGKTDQPVEEITANIKTLSNIIGKSKVKKITLSSTMGPGVKVDTSSI